MYMSRHRKWGNISFSLRGEKWSMAASMIAQTSEHVREMLVQKENVSISTSESPSYLNI